MYIILRKKTEFNRYLSRLNYTKTPETRQALSAYVRENRLTYPEKLLY